MFRITLVILSIFLLALPGAPLSAAPDWPPLMEAAFHGDLGRVENLLEAGTDVNQRDSEGSTPLMVAASRGHLSIVRRLLAKGALVNIQNTYGWTPLMMAAAAGHESIVKLLLAQGADPSIQNRAGDTAVTLARSKGLGNLFASTPEPETIKPAPPPKREPARPEEREPAKPPRESEVERLLAQAEQQLRSLRLTVPAGDNAYETYQRVLELEPGNPSARAGLQRIAEQYERLARQRERSGALQESLSFIERGLQVVPEHPGLSALRREVQARLAALEPPPPEPQAEPKEETERASQQREIERLLAGAKAQFEQGKLTEPGGDNAYETYQQILELDTENPEAKAGLTRLAGEYAQLARKRQEAGDLQASLEALDEGLKIRPEHPDLLALRDEVHDLIAERERRRIEEERQRAEEERLAEQERRRVEEERRRAEEERQRREIERLLAGAKAQFEQGKITEPAGDNAYKTYQEVLELDPGNEEAAVGLKQLVAQAERALQEKMDVLRRIEQELDAEELTMRLAIQRTLARQWKRRAAPER